MLEHKEEILFAFVYASLLRLSDKNYEFPRDVTLGLGLNTSRTVQGASFNLHRLHTVVVLTMHRLMVTHKSRNA